MAPENPSSLPARAACRYSPRRGRHRAPRRPGRVGCREKSRESASGDLATDSMGGGRCRACARPATRSRAIHLHGCSAPSAAASTGTNPSSSGPCQRSAAFLRLREPLPEPGAAPARARNASRPPRRGEERPGRRRRRLQRPAVARRSGSFCTAPPASRRESATTLSPLRGTPERGEHAGGLLNLRVLGQGGGDGVDEALCVPSGGEHGMAFQ